MSDIAGKYFTRFAIPYTEYEFTDDAAARNAHFVPSSSGNVFVTQYATNSVALYASVNIPIEVEFNIERVRLIAAGAENLGAGNASPFLAGKIEIGVGVEDPDNPGTVLHLDYCNISITKWGEWQECKKKLLPARNMSSVNLENFTQCKIFAGLSYCEFWCDDYNIQSAYKGEKTSPILEMEVKTGGLYDTVNKVLF